jgi:hypothetical protein
MVVQGQPNSAAEYIQASNQVGRLAEKPGLVLFYRAVKATSGPWRRLWLLQLAT